MNLTHETRLNIRIEGELRKNLESTLLPYREWNDHPEMPEPCWNVVTGAVFYAGCEGIGHNEENGWYLILWEPSDNNDPPPATDGKGGLTVVSAKACAGPSKADPGTFTLLFMERGSITISVERPQ